MKIKVADVVNLTTQIVTNLPAGIAVGSQVIDLIRNGYDALNDAIGDREVTQDEIDEIIVKIAANSAQIQAIA